ncbi:MAG: hypothetical protein OWS74_06660 [Firmicutes bacterium]|nr:hypothetical protein [Bacillota bacterium]
MEVELEKGFQVKFADVLEEMKESYDGYIKYYPQYWNYIKIAKIVTSEGVERAVRNKELISLVEKALTTKPTKDSTQRKITINPIEGTYSILCWNSDQYWNVFQNKYITKIVYDKHFSKNRRSLISLMEYYSLVAGLTKLVISAVTSNYVRKLLRLYSLPLEEALRKNTQIPISTLTNRVRKNFKVPKVMDNEMDAEENSIERPKSKNESKYREMIHEYQEEAPIEIRLTPEEIEEEITKRLLEEII